MIVHRLYMVMILELEGVRVERRQDCHITKMSHLHNWEASTRKTINKINTMNYLRVLCRMSSVWTSKAVQIKAMHLHSMAMQSRPKLGSPEKDSRFLWRPPWPTWRLASTPPSQNANRWQGFAESFKQSLLFASSILLRQHGNIYILEKICGLDGQLGNNGQYRQQGQMVDWANMDKLNKFNKTDDMG